MGKVITCPCGRTHDLSHQHGRDLKCECGQWFNCFGQRLNPPAMWGSETGEHFDDGGNYVSGGEE